MSATVTQMPTRAEMRARRSAAKHAGRIASARTPQAVLTAATDEVKAWLVHNNEGDLPAEVAAEAAAALRSILDRANAQVRRHSRYVA